MKSGKRAAENPRMSGSFHLAAYTLPPSSVFLREQVGTSYARERVATFFPDTISITLSCRIPWHSSVSRVFRFPFMTRPHGCREKRH